MFEKVLNLGTTNPNTVPISNAPFMIKITENGVAGGDAGFNENYSGSAMSCYWIAPRDCYLFWLSVFMGRGGLAQGSTNLSTGFVLGANTPLTNGMPFKVDNSSGALIQSICLASEVLTFADLQTLCSSSDILYDVDSATNGNNDIFTVCHLNLEEAFGSPLFLGTGNRVGVTLNDDFTGIIAFKINISGHFA